MIATKNPAIKLGCAIALILVSISILWVLNWIRNPFGSAYVVQSKKPLALAQARQVSGLPFPDTAKNIRFALFSQWIAYETFARFEAPKEDCIAFAERLIAESKRGWPTPAGGRPTSRREWPDRPFHRIIAAPRNRLVRSSSDSERLGGW